MPAYVRRPHDDLLCAVLDPAQGANRLVVLRGGSSAGKSRAAYQAVMDRLPNWRVDYPRTPTTLAERLEDGIPQRTVLWLNELRHYAVPERGLEALARLAEVMGEDGHIVVITAVWPDYWVAYTAEAHSGPGTPDPAATTRQLLTSLPDLTERNSADVNPGEGGVIDIPDLFTADDLARARRLADHVIQDAIEAAHAAGSDGQVTQYLAGVPALLSHYHGPGADPYAQALITAAMDAARLWPGPYSGDLLQDAIVGYLTDRQRTARLADWWDTALDYATRELKGAVRALEPVPPERGLGVVGYRLADYLDQHGRATRWAVSIASSVWDALVTHTVNGEDLAMFSSLALHRGLFRYAALFAAKGAAMGNCMAMCQLGGLERRAGRTQTAIDWYLRASQAGDNYAVYPAVNLLMDAARFDEAEALLRDRIQVDGDLDAMEQLAKLLEHTGRTAEAATWWRRRRETPQYQARIEMMRISNEKIGAFLELESKTTKPSFLEEKGIEGDSLLGRILLAFESEDMGELAQLVAGDDSMIDIAASVLQDAENRASARGDHAHKDAANLIDYLMYTGRFEQVEAWLRDRDEAGHPDLWAMRRLAALLKETGRVEEAITCQRCRVEVGDESALYELAHLLAYAGRNEEAARVLPFGLEPGGRTADPW